MTSSSSAGAPGGAARASATVSSTPARWLLNTLDLTYEQLDVLAHLTAEILSDPIFMTLDAETQLALTEHFELEHVIEELLEPPTLDRRTSGQRDTLTADLGDADRRGRRRGSSAGSTPLPISPRSRHHRKGSLPDDDDMSVYSDMSPSSPGSPSLLSPRLASSRRGSAVSRTSSMSGMSGQEDEDGDDVEEVVLCTVDSARTLARLLIGQPELCARIQELGAEEVKGSVATMDLLGAFQGLAMLHAELLAMTQEEEDELHERLAATEFDSEATKRMKKLKQQLAEDTEVHRAQITAKDKQIALLETRLAKLQATNADREHQFNQSVHERQSAHQERFEADRQRYGEAAESSSTSFREASRINFHAESDWHRKKFDRQQAVGALVQKYDEFMLATDAQLRALERQYEEETEERERLEEHFGRIDAERARLREERLRAHAEAQAAREKERREKTAAMLVQRIYRDFRVRAELAALKAAKKKKKKKG